MKFFMAVLVLMNLVGFVVINLTSNNDNNNNNIESTKDDYVKARLSFPYNSTSNTHAKPSQAVERPWVMRQRPQPNAPAFFVEKSPLEILLSQCLKKKKKTSSTKKATTNFAAWRKALAARQLAKAKARNAQLAADLASADQQNGALWADLVQARQQRDELAAQVARVEAERGQLASLLDAALNDSELHASGSNFGVLGQARVGLGFPFAPPFPFVVADPYANASAPYASDDEDDDEDDHHHDGHALAPPVFADEEDPYANASAPYEHELFAYDDDDDDRHGRALAPLVFADEEDPFADASAPYEHELFAYDDDYFTDQTQGPMCTGWDQTTPDDPTVPLTPVAAVLTQPQALARVETPIDVAEVLAKLPAALRNATDLTQGRVWSTTTDDDDDDRVDDDDEQQQQQQVDAVLARLPASLRNATDLSRGWMWSQ